MESTVVGIEAVESKNVNTKKGPGLLFVIKDAVNVEYTTYERELAVAAAAYKGSNQPATLGFDVVQTTKPNRQGVDTTYTNRYLKSVGPASGAQSVPVQSEHTFDSAPVPVAPVPVQAVTAPPSGSAVASHVLDALTADTNKGIQPQQSHSDREESIARAVALKAAVDLASNGVLSDPTASGITSIAKFFEPYLLGKDTIKPTEAPAFVASAAVDPEPNADSIPF
jgi:hypothetical protein